MKKNFGFTIIEMLTVIAVICILMGLVLSVTMKGRNRAKATRAISDTRQGNLISFMESSDSGYENLPGHIKEGRFSEKE